MKSSIALRPFRRSDTREFVSAGATVDGDDDYIGDLRRNGLVREVAAHLYAPENKALPRTAGGDILSASLPARASQQTTAIVYGTGEKRKRGRPRKVAP